MGSAPGKQNPKNPGILSQTNVASNVLRWHAAQNPWVPHKDGNKSRGISAEFGPPVSPTLLSPLGWSHIFHFTALVLSLPHLTERSGAAFHSIPNMPQQLFYLTLHGMAWHGMAWHSPGEGMLLVHPWRRGASSGDSAPGRARLRPGHSMFPPKALILLDTEERVINLQERRAKSGDCITICLLCRGTAKFCLAAASEISLLLSLLELTLSKLSLCLSVNTRMFVFDSPKYQPLVIWEGVDRQLGSYVFGTQWRFATLLGYMSDIWSWPCVMSVCMHVCVCS